MLDLFQTMFAMLPDSLIQAFLLALVSLGIALPFRILKLPDFTSEGAYPLGGAAFASMLTLGASPLLAVVSAAFSGALAGLCSGAIYSKLKINSLLAGIIVSTMIYGINLRILGKPNMGIFDFPSMLPKSFFSQLLLFASLVFSLGAVTIFYFKTTSGLQMRAAGFNALFCRQNGICQKKYVLLGFSAAGFLCGLSGALMVQVQSYVDVGMGVGMVIHGLAALMIGEGLVGSQTISRQIAAPIIGALAYQFILVFVLAFGFEPNDLKIMTGLMVLLATVFQAKRIST